MSASLDSIINDMIKDSPPGELHNVVSDIKTIIQDDQKDLSSSIEDFLTDDFELIQLKNDYTVISKHNKEGSKYVDYDSKTKFNVDFKKLVAIDLEEFELELSDDYLKLNKSLKTYVQEHFPSHFKSILIENENDFIIIILDLKFSPKNFYNGKWSSFYKYDKVSQQVSGKIKINVHYFEDGNVRLITDKKLEDSKVEFNDLVSFINNFENDFEKHVLIQFQELNEKYFKNLRRQLPINRAKVQWGRSINNYKLGQDVAGGKDV
ncbi:hypothetical protein PACTADRAFT_47613 [Pachysolen tannophilus NRRL Y-2460]|uniref:F-actin-capping protein subunit alpha n=1 Tax=Pachysolen tannophilus NRRL Y-2460 TaxID=669874 RepID=A0A1E4U180_PACTA|nr:hypothetical protein PACTADRAFT_47613 [Pachysolen tannophilus NRRL Y-2460]